MDRLSKNLLGMTIVAALGASSAFGQAQAQGQAQAGGQAQTEGQAPKKNWKDQAEYDLFASITKETDNNKKLSLLNSWKEKYPNTEFKQERLQLYLTTYQGLGQLAKLIDTTKEMLTNDPKDFQALYWITFLTPSLNKTDPDTLDMGEKAANGLLSNLDSTFSAEKKPATTSEADWKKARSDMEALGHKTLGWISMQRKNNEVAEQEFTKSLQINANAGEVSYWLGTVILAQKKPEKQSEALYHFARAASYDGPGALAPEGRKQLDAYLSKTYSSYHGPDEAGLKELKTLAKTQPFPPADFKITSTTEAEAAKIQREEEERKKDPQRALWGTLRTTLSGPEGEQYFQSSMKGAMLPGGAEGIKKFKGTLVSQTPRQLTVAMSDPNTPDVTLKLETPIAGKAEPGQVIEFEGIPVSYTKDPFMVTFEVEKSQISGLKTTAPPPAARRPAARKGGGRKR